MFSADPQFLVWGTAYVVLKWTVGLWLIRRAKAYLAGRSATTPARASW